MNNVTVRLTSHLLSSACAVTCIALLISQLYPPWSHSWASSVTSLVYILQPCRHCQIVLRLHARLSNTSPQTESPLLTLPVSDQAASPVPAFCPQLKYHSSGYSGACSCPAEFFSSTSLPSESPIYLQVCWDCCYCYTLLGFTGRFSPPY